ncbi:MULTISPECIES: hypothetical protein [unclassified Burkholderia]|uniref:hypothetical protein n=1 Tax=unclassified Burkholderia TaxID=2613784 RepID=UPI000F574490|nr:MULTISPECIES: hypothetical protein [unclassified Burkholderia]RQR81471.1 hypothetical protein DIE10_17880 [Burkholderia sp. Bp9011]RQR91048.1 hypothetical protein DIE09_20120 [Burkholderia sp. Bp9010]RQS75195.1 hypothetical protein DID97_16485 [Burkholderia sp. Bp8977]
MELGIDELRRQIPPYLTQPQQDGLIQALSQFPNKIDYYLDRYHSDLLQGDGWSSMDVIRFEDGSRKAVRGIVLSNSCDIDDSNERSLPPRLLFAPLIKLARYVDLLERAGVGKPSIDGKLQAIREQGITSIFFLPAGGKLEEDHIALLDDVHTLPVDYFRGKGEERQKLFTLGMTGFYLFLFKLSVHFCRFHENVERYQPA